MSSAIPTESAPPVIIKFGRKNRSQIRKLVRGEGKLMTEIQTTIDDLKRSGRMARDAQTVIVVVRERPRRLRLFS
jgi:Family of unknown function (DUF6200)